MPATPSAEKASFSSLLSLVPRQVFLTNRSNTMKQSSSDTKLLLHQSIARYLERSGFSKSLKKFRSEAQIQKDNLEGSIIDLEEMCLKYLEICCKDAKSNIDDHKEQVDGVHTGNKEEVNSKEKKKKKNKPASEFHANVEDNPLEPETTVTDKKGKDDVSASVKIVNGSETEKKSKDKKKKKDKTSNQGDAMEKNQNSVENVLKEDNIKASNKEVTDQEKKESKKRKRPISEENGDRVADKKADEETKRRRTENSDESKVVEKLTKTSESAAEKSNGETNGHLESAAEKSSTQKCLKKQQKESAEKTVKKAFQRVQADKVQFADERLQDNSYWAKDGADTGYGAKAEEILGQVRGRDFRHEKTKKKRGSYRGGQIDLHSHSIKFNYSDEE